MPLGKPVQLDSTSSATEFLLLSDDRGELIVDVSKYDDATVQVTDAVGASWGNVTLHVGQSDNGTNIAAFSTPVTATAAFFSAILNVRGVRYLHIKLVPAAFPSTGTGYVWVSIKAYARR